VEKQQAKRICYKKQQVKRSYSLLEAELLHMAGNNS
jgi:hypothetical protein